MKGMSKETREMCVGVGGDAPAKVGSSCRTRDSREAMNRMNAADVRMISAWRWRDGQREGGGAVSISFSVSMIAGSVTRVTLTCGRRGQVTVECAWELQC